MFRMGPRGLEPCQSLLPRAFAGQGLDRAQYPDWLQRGRENVFGGIPRTTGYLAVSRRMIFTDSGRRLHTGAYRTNLSLAVAVMGPGAVEGGAGVYVQS